jgi:(p)ppGpp synthase/HD superfamily hydrolase
MLPESSVTSSKVMMAKHFAIQMHHGQKYGGLPYYVHLQAVESVAVRFGIENVHILAACWLHDVIEDTSTTYDDILNLYGKLVADAVQAVSEPKEGTRKEKHTITYPQIEKNNIAIIVKLCDRISNVEVGTKNDMYRSEHLEFKKYLYGKDLKDLQTTYDSMCRYLDGLLLQS